MATITELPIPVSGSRGEGAGIVEPGDVAGAEFFELVVAFEQSAQQGSGEVVGVLEDEEIVEGAGLRMRDNEVGGDVDAVLAAEHQGAVGTGGKERDHVSARAGE